MTKGRMTYIDVVAGIMIIWMILGHCRHFSSYQLPFPNYLAFYMPWFFYKSGLFFNTKENKDLLRNDVAKYLRFFLVYSFIGWVVWSICGLLDDSILLKDCFVKPINTFAKSGCIKGNGALWFLLSLFIVRQIANVILKNCNKHIPIFTIPIISFFCFVAAYLLYANRWYSHSWWIGNILSGLCFFLLGYWLRDKEKRTRLFIISVLVYFSIVFASSANLIDGFPYLYMHANKMYSGNYLLFFPMALAGIIMTNNVFRYLCKHMNIRIFEYVGQNSMNFYVTHWILFTIVVFVAKYFFDIVHQTSLMLLLVVTSVVILPLLSMLINSLKTKYGI